MLEDDDPGAWGQILDPGADLLDNPHRLVAGDPVRAIPDPIGAPPVEVEVAPAHGRHRRAQHHPSAPRFRLRYGRQLCAAITQDS
jgi:hypothetical protein